MKYIKNIFTILLVIVTFFSFSVGAYTSAQNNFGNNTIGKRINRFDEERAKLEENFEIMKTIDDTMENVELVSIKYESNKDKFDDYSFLISEIQNKLGEFDIETQKKLKELDDSTQNKSNEDEKSFFPDIKRQEIMTYGQFMDEYQDSDYEPWIAKDRLIYVEELYYENGYYSKNGFIENALLMAYYDAETADLIGTCKKSLSPSK